jgi:DNA-binding MarR family transcriptional regulator
MHIERKLLEDCACQRVRMAARAVTRAYDEALRPVGLRATQLSVLVGVAAEPTVSIASLSRLLGMDRSTLTRNLRPLLSHGLISRGPEGWHRSRALEITSKGSERLRKAVPLWEGMQEGLKRKLGRSRLSALRVELDYLGKAAEHLQLKGRASKSGASR